MKNKAIWIASLTVIALCICSCHHPAVNGKVKREESKDSKGILYTYTYSYSYDSLGRQTEALYESSKKTIRWDYSHRDSVINYQQQGSDIDTVVWLLDKAGYVSQTGNTGYHTLYTYDKDGFPIRETYEYLGVYLEYALSGADIASRTMITGEGDTSRDLYTYYPEIDYRDYGQPYLGRHSTHLVKTQTYISDKHESSERQYSYTYDAQGRVLTETILISSTDRSITHKYTYTDK